MVFQRFFIRSLQNPGVTYVPILSTWLPHLLSK